MISLKEIQVQKREILADVMVNSLERNEVSLKGNKKKKIVDITLVRKQEEIKQSLFCLCKYQV